MDLFDAVNDFADKLNDSNKTANASRLRCARLISSVRTFASAWNNLLASLQNPQIAPRPQFHGNFNRLCLDIEQIIYYFDASLDRAIKAHERSRKRVRFWFGHHAEHPVEIFFKSKDLDLRNAQIILGARVAEVMHFTALHCLSSGYTSSSQEDYAQMLDQQRSVVEQEKIARNHVEQMSRSVRDNLALDGKWLNGYSFSGGSLPLTRVAASWFQWSPVGTSTLEHQFRQMQADQAELRHDLRESEVRSQRIARQHADLVVRHEELMDRHGALLRECETMRQNHAEDERRWRADLAVLERRTRTAEDRCNRIERERDDLRRQLDDIRARSTEYGPTAWSGRGPRRRSSRSGRSHSRQGSPAGSCDGRPPSRRDESEWSDSGISVNSSTHGR